MSELNIYRELEDYVGYDNVPLEMYDKDEVDNVIAELNKQKEYVIEQTAEVINRQELELRHQKYKRCLSMAKMCREKEAHYRAEYDAEEGFGDGWLKWIRWAKTWCNRWLAIAEKFKETK